MIKLQSRVRFCNGNNDHRNQKQFFHTMLPALLKLGSASIVPAVIAVLGFSTICSKVVLAASSDEKAQSPIGSRLKESKNTAKEVKGQEPKTFLPSETSLRVDTGKESKSQEPFPSSISGDSKISPPQRQSLKLAEIGDSPVAPTSPSTPGSGSMFDRQGGSLFDLQQPQQPQQPQQQQTQGEPALPLQENSTPPTRQRSRSKIQTRNYPCRRPSGTG